MTDIWLDYEPNTSRDRKFPPALEDNYNLPILPKIGIIVNIIAAIFACIFTVIVTIANSHTNIDCIVVLSKLMFCFVAGGVVSLLAALADYGARSLYRMEARNGQSFWKCGEIVDCAALAMSIASLAVFGWGVWRAYAALRGVEVHF